MQIEGTAAIVTGGASGLGAATARRLADAGARVTVLDLATSEELAGGAIGFHRTDITQAADVDAALAAAEAANGPARILVNCAGVLDAIRTVDRDLEPHDIGRFRRIIEVNLVGSFLVLSRFAARLAKAERVGEERGVIINTTSIAAYDGPVGLAAYAASKAGVVGLTLPIARELADLQIRVVAVAPGIFATPMASSVEERSADAISQIVPHPARMGRPEEFAQLVEAVIANPMLNGETIRIDAAARLGAR